MHEQAWHVTDAEPSAQRGTGAMIERLQRELADLERLSADEQEELALYIAALRQAHAREAAMPPVEQTQPWQDPAGAWSDLPEDDEAETFYRMRHETEPSAPIEL
jgi:hypothetical protein